MKIFLLAFLGITVLFILLGIYAAMCISGHESRKEEKR